MYSNLNEARVVDWDSNLGWGLESYYDSNLLIDKGNIEEERKNGNIKIPQRYFEYIQIHEKTPIIDGCVGLTKNEVLNEVKVKEGRVTVLDSLIIEEKNGEHVGKLEYLAIEDIEVSNTLVEKYKKSFFQEGVYAVMTLESNLRDDYKIYVSEDGFEPMEYTEYRLEELKNIRNTMSTKQWFDLVISTLGYDPNTLLFWEKIFLLVRVITFCEESYHLMELGKRGVGKNYLYELFKSQAEIITGTATVANLYYNENKKRDGSIVKNDVVVFNEIGDLKFKEENIVPSLQTYMSGEEVRKGRLIPQGTSLVFMGNIDYPEFKLENNEILIDQLNKQFDKSALLDRFCYFIPNWGMREMQEIFYVKNGQKSIPLDYFGKILKELRSVEVNSLVKKRIEALVPQASSRDKTAITKTVSGLIKILHLGEQPSEEELQAYIAIAMKGRHLLSRQMMLMSSDNYQDKGLSPFINTNLNNNFLKFIWDIEGLSGQFLGYIPNRIAMDYGNAISLYALDSIGLEKNKRINVNAADYKNVLQNKGYYQDNYNRSIFYVGAFTMNEYFIDYSAEHVENLFGEIIPLVIRNQQFPNQYGNINQYVAYLDSSMVYKYKKNPPKQLKCGCKDKGNAILTNIGYKCLNCQTLLDVKFIKKQFLELGVI